MATVTIAPLFPAVSHPSQWSSVATDQHLQDRWLASMGRGEGIGGHLDLGLPGVVPQALGPFRPPGTCCSGGRCRQSETVGQLGISQPRRAYVGGYVVGHVRGLVGIGWGRRHGALTWASRSNNGEEADYVLDMFTH